MNDEHDNAETDREMTERYARPKISRMAVGESSAVPVADTALNDGHPSEMGERNAMLFGTWLEQTEQLQRDAYGADLRALEGEAYAAHVRMNVTAIVAELGEMLEELPGWKTWVENPGRPDMAGRLRAVNELVDVLHFVANLLVGLRSSDLELRILYGDKMQRNRARQEAGYDGVSSKCPGCGRALDDVGTSDAGVVGTTKAHRVCNACGAIVTYGIDRVDEIVETS